MPLELRCKSQAIQLEQHYGSLQAALLQIVVLNTGSCDWQPMPRSTVRDTEQVGGLDVEVELGQQEYQG